jgi:hypothetical protein
MSIQELSSKFKGFFHNVEYMLTVLIIVVSCLSFYLGRMSVANEDIQPISMPASSIQHDSLTGSIQATASPVTSEISTTPSNTETSLTPEVGQGKYVASKKGTKYHLPWCPGAKQIKEENKLWFDSKEEAEKAGYTKATNCKGL